MDEHYCNCCAIKNGLTLPGLEFYIKPGNVVVLGRFSTIKWKVGFGWFSYEGNRKICGWYLKQLNNPHNVKPIQETDLHDIYVLEM